MDEENQEIINKQREKRKRVHRMKMAIVAFLFIYFIVSILVLILLSVRSISMQKEIDTLKELINDDGKEKADETKAESIDNEVLVLDKASVEANLAKENDTLKVYLTFDDGPSKNTNAILDILDDYNVKATFFVVGKTDPDSLAAMKRIVDEGHTIGMHSYSHKYAEIYASPEAFREDFSKIENLIYDTTGVEPKYYRFPGGSSNRVSNIDMSEYIKYLNDNGIKYFDWNVASGDATTRAYSEDELVENVMKDVVKYKTSVVLMHDGNEKNATVRALPKMIEALQSKGALILPISDDTTLIQHVTLSDSSN